MAIIKNITVDQYSDWEKTFCLFDQNHAPFDLTGYTGYAQIKKSPQATDILATFTTEILQPPTLGKITLSLSYLDLVGIKPEKYAYDILLVSSTAKIRAVQGSVDISGNITT